MIVYSITHKASDTLVYIGSTHQPLCDRKANHHYNYKHKPLPVHIYMNQMDGWDAYEFNIISEHPDITRDALKVIEGNLIRQHNPPYNTQRNPSRTEDDVKEYYKDYYEQHSDMKKKYAKERGLLRYACECGANVRFVEKARHFKSKKHTG